MVSVSDCVVLKYSSVSKHLTIATTTIQKYLGIKRFNSPEGMTNTFNVIIIIIFFHLLPFLMVGTLSLCNNVIIFCPVLLILSAECRKSHLRHQRTKISFMCQDKQPCLSNDSAKCDSLKTFCDDKLLTV